MGVGIRGLRELLIAVGEQRRRLGLLALQNHPDDWSSRLDASKVSDAEPKALEEG